MQPAPDAKHGAMPEPLRPVLVGSPVFRKAAFGANHPLSIRRVEIVHALCESLDWLDPELLRTCHPAPKNVLLKFHAPEYVAALERADAESVVSPQDRDRFNFGTMENPWFPGLLERAATTVGGAILAAEIALTGATTFHPSGGTHHGMPDRAHGFCYFNDPVFAILTLLEHGLDRVAYVDLDAHHGDGVESAFADDPRVLTASIHDAGRWPYSGTHWSKDGGIINLPVPAGCNDSEFAYLVDGCLRPALEAFAPDAIVVTCGTDALAGDPLSSMNLSNVCLWDSVLKLRTLSPRCVVLGGGGYNPWTLARCWAGLWGHLAGKPMPDELPVVARAVLTDLECDLIDDDEIVPSWLTTLADESNLGSVRQEVRELARNPAMR